MARQTLRRRAWTGISLVTSLVVVGAAAWGLQRWAPFADDVAGPSWPDNVQPVVDSVEHITGQQFIGHVNVDFIPNDDQYRAQVQRVPAEPTDEERAMAATDEGVARALGLWAGDASVIAFRAAYATAHPIPVTWVADTDTIIINAQNSSTELSPLLRADLAVRLTQALDNQLYRTVRHMALAPTSQEYQALVAISIGHALWVRDLYVGEFSADDLDDYSTEADGGDTDWAAAMSEVPVAYRAIRAVGQQIGPMFVEALTEKSRLLFAQSLTTHVPTALDQISLPISKYVHRDPLEQVSDPPGPAGAEVLSANQMGPFATYLLLSTGMPLHVALTASDGWGNDRYTAYMLDGRVCVDLHLVADSHDDAERLENGLNGWARARPVEADALVGRDGNHLYATACDPGADVEQSTPTEAAVQQYLARAQELQNRADETGDPGLAECVALTFYASHDVDRLEGSLNSYSEFDNIEQDCLSSL